MAQRADRLFPFFFGVPKNEKPTRLEIGRGGSGGGDRVPTVWLYYNRGGLLLLLFFFLGFSFLAPRVWYVLYSSMLVVHTEY